MMVLGTDLKPKVEVVGRKVFPAGFMPIRYEIVTQYAESKVGGAEETTRFVC